MRRKIILSLAALGTLCAPALLATSAHAQATRTWVSGVGDDANPCSRTAPCKTFAGAISKTAINGEINCLDPGGFGAVTITKSITIDCHEVMAGILASGFTGVIINIAAGNANDPLRTVRLRNININGAGVSGTIGTRTGLNGIRIDAAAVVSLDDMLVYNFTQRGLLDQRTSAGKLIVRNSIFRDNAGAGLVILPSGGVQAAIDAAIEHSQFTGNQFGIAVNNGARAVAARSVFSGNTFGIDAEATVGNATLVVNDSVVSGNATGFFQSGGGAIRLSNSDFNFNNTQGSGTLNSFTNNRFSGNGAGGTVSPIGVATSPTGQQ